MILPLRGALSPLGQAGKVPSSLLNGLVAYWKLDEASGSRADSLGVATLTDNNGVTQAAGKIGNAAVFANTKFLSRAGTAFQFPNVDFTVSLWVNPTTLAGASVNGRGICRCSNGEAVGDWIIAATALGGVFCSHWESAGIDATGRHATSATGLLITGSWTHVVFRRSGGTYTIWTDGVSRAFGDGTTNSGFGDVGFQIGRLAAGASLAFDGAIDEAAIFNRGLTDGEIAALFNGGAGLTYPF